MFLLSLVSPKPISFCLFHPYRFSYPARLTRRPSPLLSHRPSLTSPQLSFPPPSDPPLPPLPFPSSSPIARQLQGRGAATRPAWRHGQRPPPFPATPPVPHRPPQPRSGARSHSGGGQHGGAAHSLQPSWRAAIFMHAHEEEQWLR